MKVNKFSPKADFIQQHRPEADAHMETVMNPKFKEAVQVAFLEYIANVTTDDPRSVYAIGGIRDFIKVLYNLGQEISPPLSQPSDELEPT